MTPHNSREANLGVPEFSRFPARLREAAELELDDGESVLWAGMPVASRFVREVDRSVWLMLIALLACGLLVAAVAVLTPVRDANGHALARQDESYLPLLMRKRVVAGILAGGWVMLCVGGGYAAHVDAGRQARRRAFVLTDLRLIQFRIGSAKRLIVEDFGPDDVRRMWRTEYPDGVGSLWLELPSSGSQARRQRAGTAVAREGELERLIRTRFGQARHGARGAS